jgi:hypothetical protein
MVGMPDYICPEVFMMRATAKSATPCQMTPMRHRLTYQVLTQHPFSPSPLLFFSCSGPNTAYISPTAPSFELSTPPRPSLSTSKSEFETPPPPNGLPDLTAMGDTRTNHRPNFPLWTLPYFPTMPTMPGCPRHHRRNANDLHPWLQQRDVNVWRLL